MRFLFADGTRDTPANPAAAADHAQKLFEHIDAPWPKDNALFSPAECHLILILHGLNAALLPHMSAVDDAGLLPLPPMRDAPTNPE